MQLKIKIDFSSEKDTATAAQPAPFDPVKIRNFGLFLILMSSLVCSMAYSMWPNDQAYASAALGNDNDGHIGILPIIVEDDQPPKQPDIVLRKIESENAALVQDDLLLINETSSDAEGDNSLSIEGTAEIPTETDSPAILNDIVTRAQITSAIVRREPIDNLGALSLSQQRQLYFFTQISQQNGKIVYHRWSFNDKLMAQIKLAIGSDKWRTYSSKTFNHNMLGQWKVEVINDNEQVLKTVEFDVTQ